MNTLQSIASHYCAIPFAVALFLPGRKSVAGFGAAFAALMITANSGPGEMSFAGMAVLTAALAAGNGARSRLLALPPGKRRTAMLATAGAAGLLLLPGSLAADFAVMAHAASATLHEWETRAPATTCFARTYAISVAGATYRVPAAPIVTVQTARYSYHFQSNHSVRAMCELADGKGEPIHVQNLNLDFSVAMRGPFCGTAASGWGQALCRPRPEAARAAYPLAANLYSPEEYDRGHMMATHSYADFVHSRDRAAASGHPFEPAQVGAFDRYPNGYWVARNNAWKNEADEPHTFQCQEAAQPGTLSCATTYRLKTGPQLSYRFDAPASRVEAVAREVDRNLHELIAEFAAS